MFVQKHLTGFGEFRLRCKQPAVGCDLLQRFALKRCGLLISPATKLHRGHFFPPCQTATPFRDAFELVTHLLVGSDVNIPAASEEPL